MYNKKPLRPRKKFYAFAIEENDSYSLVLEDNMPITFETLDNAKEIREDHSEYVHLLIAHVEILDD